MYRSPNEKADSEEYRRLALVAALPSRTRRTHDDGSCVLFLFGYVCLSIGAIYSVSLRGHLAPLGANRQLIGP